MYISEISFTNVKDTLQVNVTGIGTYNKFINQLDCSGNLGLMDLNAQHLCDNLGKVEKLFMEKCTIFSGPLECSFEIAMPAVLEIKAASSALDAEVLTWGLNHTVGLVSLVALVGIAGISITALSRCVWNKPATKI